MKYLGKEDFRYKEFHDHLEHLATISLDKLFCHLNNKEFLCRAFYCSANHHSIFHLSCNKKFHIRFSDRLAYHLHSTLLKKIILHTHYFVKNSIDLLQVEAIKDFV